jgi:hypothetical protein|tara:strand:- start:265 stop:687 length:423 start_codon:yes stop_codon:yes gene_type:complete
MHLINQGMLSRSYVTSPTAHNLTNPTPLWSKAFDEMCGVESSVTLGQVFTHPVLCCIDGVPYRSEICPSYTDNELARLAACGLAAREVVQVHVHLAAVLDGIACIAAETAADGVGDDTWLGPDAFGLGPDSVLLFCSNKL